MVLPTGVLCALVAAMAVLLRASAIRDSFDSDGLLLSTEEEALGGTTTTAAPDKKAKKPAPPPKDVAKLMSIVKKTEGNEDVVRRMKTASEACPRQALQGSWRSPSRHFDVRIAGETATIVRKDDSKEWSFASIRLDDSCGVVLEIKGVNGKAGGSHKGSLREGGNRVDWEKDGRGQDADFWVRIQDKSPPVATKPKKKADCPADMTRHKQCTGGRELERKQQLDGQGQLECRMSCERVGATCCELQKPEGGPNVCIAFSADAKMIMWAPPLEDGFSERFALMCNLKVIASNSPVSSVKSHQEDKEQQPRYESHSTWQAELPPGWQMLVDEQEGDTKGSNYYYNAEKDISQWERPTWELDPPPPGRQTQVDGLPMVRRASPRNRRQSQFDLNALGAKTVKETGSLTSRGHDSLRMGVISPTQGAVTCPPLETGMHHFCRETASRGGNKYSVDVTGKTDVECVKLCEGSGAVCCELFPEGECDSNGGCEKRCIGHTDAQATSTPTRPSMAVDCSEHLQQAAEGEEVVPKFPVPLSEASVCGELVQGQFCSGNGITASDDFGKKGDGEPLAQRQARCKVWCGRPGAVCCSLSYNPSTDQYRCTRHDSAILTTLPGNLQGNVKMWSSKCSKVPLPSEAFVKPGDRVMVAQQIGYLNAIKMFDQGICKTVDTSGDALVIFTDGPQWVEKRFFENIEVLPAFQEGAYVMATEDIEYGGRGTIKRWSRGQVEQVDSSGDVLIEFGPNDKTDWKWVLKQHLWMLQLDQEHWNAERIFRLCKRTEKGLYKGKVTMLEGERSMTQTAAELNKGAQQGRLAAECPQGFCAVDSSRGKEWYVMYRPGFHDAAMRAVGFKPENFNWDERLCFKLCDQDRYEEFAARFQGDIELLPWGSATMAAKNLNANLITIHGGFAVFFSKRRQEFEVLYRPKSKTHALLALGLEKMDPVQPPASPMALSPPQSPVQQRKQAKNPFKQGERLMRKSSRGEWKEAVVVKVGLDAVPDKYKNTATVASPADWVLTEYVAGDPKGRNLLFYEPGIKSMEEYSRMIRQSLLEVEAGRGADRARRAGSMSGDGDVALA